LVHKLQLLLQLQLPLLLQLLLQLPLQLLLQLQLQLLLQLLLLLPLQLPLQPENNRDWFISYSPQEKQELELEIDFTSALEEGNEAIHKHQLKNLDRR
jgi:hypothetical protein